MTTRTLTAIAGNSQRLDGGAMFGNAPKPVWEKWIAPDERNRIPLACRAMLIEEKSGGATKRILFETGIGAFFSPKMRDRFGVVESEHVLLESLVRAGAPHDTIDVVVLSHLHFDHAGGLLTAYAEGAAPELLFPKATFVVGAEAWERAKHPHARDRASFIPELVPLLETSGRLEVAAGERSQALGPAYRLHRSSGHTPSWPRSRARAAPSCSQPTSSRAAPGCTCPSRWATTARRSCSSTRRRRCSATSSRATGACSSRTTPPSPWPA